MKEALAVAGQELPPFAGPDPIEKNSKPDPSPDTIGNEAEGCRRLPETASQSNVNTQVHFGPSAAQPQPPTAPNGATTGTTPVVTGVGSTTTESRSISAEAETQAATFASAKVPDSQALALQPPIVALSATDALSLISTTA